MPVQAAVPQPRFVEWLTSLLHETHSMPYYRTKFRMKSLEAEGSEILWLDLEAGSWDSLGCPLEILVHVFSPDPKAALDQLLTAAAISGREGTRLLEAALRQHQDPNCANERGETAAWRASRTGDFTRLVCRRKTGTSRCLDHKN